MTMPETPWDPQEWDPEQYRYEQIADWIAQRIAAGVWPAKTVLSEVRIQVYFGVGRATIRKAFELLRERGLIVTKPAVGSVVRDAQPPRGDILD